MVSGFTEIMGRAGLSTVVMLLMAGSLTAIPLAAQTGYMIMCFCTPLAWLFGLLTVWPDYIAMRRSFKKIMAAKADASAAVGQAA